MKILKTQSLSGRSQNNKKLSSEKRKLKHDLKLSSWRK